MQVHVLASGSTGNAVYIEMGTTRLLVDAGISARRIQLGLKEIGVDVSTLDAVLITHEHSDHVKGLEVLARRYQVPVYARPATWEALPCRDKMPFACCQELSDTITLGDIEVQPFSISHDAVDPVGFSFFQGRNKCVLATDLGFVTPEVQRHLNDADVLVLESNHDLAMLAQGPYPYYLKQRIRSKVGHLSNLDCARLLASVPVKNGAQVFLAHLSQQNNTPALAEKTVEDFLTARGCEVGREIVLNRTYPDHRVGVEVR